jgi:hypothetical protein
MPNVPLYATRPPYLGDEMPLIECDNIVLGSFRLSRSEGWEWNVHLRKYLTAVDQGLERALDIAARRSGVEIEGSLSFYMYRTEVYWEVSHPNPISLVSSLGPRLRQVSQYVSSATYETIDEENSPRIECRLNGGGSLAIYAKTNQRVRFEVRFMKKHSPEPRILISQPHLERFVTALVVASARAEQRLNQLLVSLPRSASKRSKSIDLLLEEIRRASETGDVAYALLQILAHRGSIDTRPSRSLAKAANKLFRRGVLVRVRKHARVMRLAPGWPQIHLAGQLQSVT